MNINKRLIYSLRCPFTCDVHYVGKTINGMTRPMSHMTRTDEHKVTEWVDELKRLGHAPEVKVLEYVPNEVDMDGRERYWIQYYMNKGNLLLNINLVTPLLISTDLGQMLSEYHDSLDVLKIANFIKERRRQVNLDQPTFAKKCGIALTVLRKLEQGKTNMSYGAVLHVLKMFGCTLDVVRIRPV